MGSELLHELDVEGRRREPAPEVAAVEAPPARPEFALPVSGTAYGDGGWATAQRKALAESDTEARSSAAPKAAPGGLVVGRADDACETEADQVAHDVVRALRQPEANRSEVAGPTDHEPADRVEGLRRSSAGQADPLGGSAVDAEISSVLQRRKGGGSPLPGKVAESMGQSLAHDFSGVRVHTDSEADTVARSLQAKAFTVGKDIYFSKGTFDTSSEPGQHLLAHELAHTVQSGEARAIQRLMDPAVFKTQTPGDYRSRSKVAAMDKLLAKYEALGAADAAFISRQQILTELERQTTAYDGHRTDGVRALAATIAVEKKVVEPTVAAINGLLAGGRDTLKAAIKSIFTARDELLAADRAGHRMLQRQWPDIADLFGRAQRGLGPDRAAVFRELIQEDLAALQAIARDPGTDPLVKDLINEVMTNKDDTHFQETEGLASGAVLANAKDRGKGITTKYRVDMQMDQGQGTTERFSSLLHEMTHVSVQETFANSAIHLAVKTDATKGDILALSARRTKQLRDLAGLADQLNGHLTPSQISVIRSKITYPIEGKNTLTSYADAFKKKGELSDTKYDEIMDLVASGANNTLTEFDTVVNQMYFLVTQWGVPGTNPFVVELRAAVQEAYDYRASARA